MDFPSIIGYLPKYHWILYHLFNNHGLFIIGYFRNQVFGLIPNFFD